MAAPQAKTCEGCKTRHLKCSRESPCEHCVKAGIPCQRMVNYKFKVNRNDFPSDQPWVDWVDWGEPSLVTGDNDLSALVLSDLPSPALTFGDSHDGQDEDPYSAANAARQNLDHSLSSRSISRSIVSPLYSINSSQLQHSQFPLSETDAALVKYFMRVLSPWIDCCDLRRPFTVYVSRRLPGSTPLLKAVLAISAQHLNAIGQFDSLVSDEYYQTALENVIPVLRAGNPALDEDILAATVILRLRAEFDVPETGINHQHNLLGTQAFIEQYKNTNPLSEFQIALAWISLRQELRVAVTAQRPAQFPLDCFQIDWASTPKDDAEWANRMVLHLAEVLNYCYGTAVDVATYKNLTSRSQEWRELKSQMFIPLFSELPTVNSRLPRCEFVNDAVVTGLQHYNLSKIILAVCHPLNLLGSGDISFQQEISQIIDHSIRKLCGIGLWNSDCACAIGLACIGIRLWGDRFLDPADQREFQRILDLAKEKHALQI